MRKPTSMTVAIVCWVACAVTQASALEQIALDKRQETRIVRLLHPLPQEVRLKGVAYREAPKDCAVRPGGNASDRERQMIDDFRSRWRERFGLAPKSGTAALAIVAGVVKNSPELQQAAERGVFDAKYLAERRNPEQAYAIAMASGGQGATVYVAANDARGLYYGLLTLYQLLTSHSTRDTVVLPHAHVVDWPDVRLRGSWTVLDHVGNDEKAVKHYEQSLRAFSRWKFNLAEAWHLHTPKLGEDGTVKAWWTFPKEAIGIGRRYAVKVYPGTGHIPHKMGVPDLKKRFPGAVATTQIPERKSLSMCQSHPDTQEMLDQYLVSIARQYDFAEIWLSELEGPRGVCHCPECKGNLREYFLKETQRVMHAYGEARKVNPAFKIMLGLTQGSYPHNLAMLQYIPKDVPLTFYNGKMTYKAYFRTYNLPPSAQEMMRLGYTIGMCPNPIETQQRHPFQTPQYCRLLCGEAEDRRVDFVLLHMFPNPFAHDLNGQACAEFLWNSRGRTAEEFTTAWATRKGLDNPEEVAAIIGMLEYPARGLHNCNVQDVVDAVVRFITGKDRATSFAYMRYEFRSHEEMARMRAICEDATERAKRLSNPELIAGCELLEHWITILERYAWCVVNPKDKAGREKAVRAIQVEVKALPETRARWLKFKEDLLKRARRWDLMNRYMAMTMKAWQPIFDREQTVTSPESMALLMAQEEGDLEVVPLNPVWRFKTVADGVGLSQKWFSSDLRDGSWSTVRSDKDCGWEKQGFDGYTGYGWYRQNLEVPDELTEKKHVFLLFQAVDEDAEVFINGKKAFEHSYKTVGGRPGSTWNRPFRFDAKPFLKEGGANLVTVRVYNRAGMGGLWKPVTLIASDVEADAKALVGLVVATEGGE